MDHETPDDPRDAPRGPVPDAKDSAVLMLDAVLTLLQLGKAESRQWLEALPQLLLVDLFRLPALLLTWIGFGVFVACTVFSFTQDIALAAGSFFVLQLGLTLLLQSRHQRLRARMEFRETRKGLASFQEALKERFGSEGP